MLIDLKNAFSDKGNDNYTDDRHIERIIKSYILSKQDQANASACYQVGNEWMPIYARYMGESIDALLNKNVGKVNKLFSNFFRESLSTGLHGLHFDMVDKYMTPGKPLLQQDIDTYMGIVVTNLNLFLRSCPNVPVTSLVRPMIGNPYGFDIDGTFINLGADIHFYTAQKIRMLLSGSGSPKVLELGGGYGGMAYFLMRDLPECTYIDFDLPENAALTAYYLLSAFPEKKIALYGEVDIATDDLDAYDAIILPNFEIERLKENSIDLAFNAYSLAEMAPDTIANYVKTICKASSKHFYHLNHAVHSLISADLFPVDTEKFALLFRFPSMWGKSKERNSDIDEHEYVYVVKK
jgi:hypothetical protein